LARVKRLDLQPIINEVVNDLRPVWEQEKKADSKFQNRVSPFQWQMGRRLANIPNDKNIDAVLVDVSMMLTISKATLQLRRKVALAFPTPHPEVCFGVYAELVRADAEDREAIFQGRPDPVDPEDWTVEAMKIAVREFYDVRRKSPKAQETKSLNFRGFGRVTVVRTDDGLEITLPPGLDVETLNKAASTILTVTVIEEAIAV
jgi:hypothetical protein